MKIYTIGYSQKTAQRFFELLRIHRIQRIVDVRHSPNSHLSGYARQRDLPYFLHYLSDGCRYVHLAELAPTRNLSAEYRADGDWERYCSRFEQLMDERNIPQALDQGEFDLYVSCLMCADEDAEKSHRGLVADRLQARWHRVAIIHL